MSASFSRRSKVLLALVASMTLGSGLLLGLAPDPIQPLPSVKLAATTSLLEKVTVPQPAATPKPDKPAGYLGVKTGRQRLPSRRARGGGGRTGSAGGP